MAVYSGITMWTDSEAKAYANPLTPLSQMLDDVFDKDEHGAWRAAVKDARGRQSSGRKKRPASAATKKNDAVPQKPTPDVMQMSHVWVQQRLTSIHNENIRKDLTFAKGSKKTNYTRHVVLFSIPHVYEHAVALAEHMQGQPVQDSDHAKHDVTREFNDRELDIEEKRRNDKRAAKKGSAK